MKLDDIIKLMDAAKESGFNKLDLKDGDFRIRLERGRPATKQTAEAAQYVEEQPAPQPEKEAGALPDIPNSKDIVSPLVGIFHELTGGKAVKPGDVLKKGDPVCLIEAMKLMNEISMPEDGEIAWAAAEEGSTVEYGQLLFSYVK